MNSISIHSSPTGTAASSALEQGEGWEWAIQRPLFFTILYLPDSPMIGDIDNIVKPILDALCPNIYQDDSQIERVIVQKFEPDRPIVINDPSVTLAEAIEHDRPVVYVRIDDQSTVKEVPL